jgi:hypothetical protein
MRHPVGGFLTTHIDHTLGRRLKPGDTFKECRFTGTIGPYQAAQLTRVKPEVNVVCRNHAAKAHSEGMRFKNNLSH